MENTAPEMVSETPQASSSTNSSTNAVNVDTSMSSVILFSQIARNHLANSLLDASRLLSRTRGQLKYANKTIIEQRLELKKAQKQLETLTRENVKISKELNQEKKKRFEVERKFQNILQAFEKANVSFAERQNALNTDEVQQFSCSKKAKLDGLGQQKVNEVERMDQDSTEPMDLLAGNAGLGYSGHRLVDHDLKN